MKGAETEAEMANDGARTNYTKISNYRTIRWGPALARDKGATWPK